VTPYLLILGPCKLVQLPLEESIALEREQRARSRRGGERGIAGEEKKERRIRPLGSPSRQDLPGAPFVFPRQHIRYTHALAANCNAV